VNKQNSIKGDVFILILSLGLMVGISRSFAADTTPQATSLKTIIEKIQTVYSNSEDFQANFVQTTAHKMFPGRLERSYGTVKFKKGGLMRWEYKRPEVKFFIYDGKTLWVYEPEVPQVFAGTADADRLRRALAFISGEGKILDEYAVKRLDASQFNFSKGVVLGLTPKDTKSPYKRIELYVDTATYRVVRSVVVDHENNRNRIDFINAKTGIGLPASAFSFTPPKGVPVITPKQ
jgi:outer membrane lipoprotein carrier protein